VAKIPDVLQHDFYMQQIADTLHLSYGQLSHIYDELGKVRHSNSRQVQNNNTIQKKQVEDMSKGSSEEPLDFLTTYALPEEKEILRLALTHEPSLKTLCVKLNITRQAFLSDTAAKLYEEVVLAFVNHGGRPPHMVLSERGDLEDDVRDLLMEILFDQHTLSNKWKDFNVKIPQNVEERLLVESLARLRMKHLDKEIEALRKRLQMELSQEEELELLSKITVLVKERHDIPLKFHTSSI
jgi:hypothetical protein